MITREQALSATTAEITQAVADAEDMIDEALAAFTGVGVIQVDTDNIDCALDLESTAAARKAKQILQARYIEGGWRVTIYEDQRDGSWWEFS